MTPFEKLYLEKKYVSQIENQLPQSKLKKSSPYLLNFRCLYCGDSDKNKFKSRGYIIEGDKGLGMYCHNCGKSLSFQSFLKDNFPVIYEEFLLEIVNENPNIEKEFVRTNLKPIKKITVSPLKILKKISQLKPDHYAKKYVENRKIPNKYHSKLYHCPKFYAWINKYVPDKFSEKALHFDGPRLIIPLIDENNNCFGVQGRAYKKSAGIRYITILFDENKNKIFGLDDIDKNKKVYIFEGPIDSMFIENSIAITGTHSGDFDFMDYVYVLDNQPRNAEVLKVYQKHINNNENVCIWPTNINKKEDINDMILNGWSPQEIKSLIDNNTYNGLEAELQFGEWKGL